ncbi:IS66 family insertion sequence element accessory protein TnpB [Sorangium sp. So ce1182]|uniref:IS66 family insertion sequence element accessory protein TnpB n=1 Tax=Sorangium sp. So ce1182 TaxID=3133334 RepID=UPI003F5E8752
MRVYIAAEPTDLRKSFDGLSLLVSQRFGADPLCGQLFVFRNRPRQRSKRPSCR